MTKLHEILAVEPDLEGTAKKIVKETERTFERAELFLGFDRTWEMFAEADQRETPPAERQRMETTVGERLDYTAKHLTKYYDGVLTKELANQEAKADLAMDGKVLIKDAPATFLLGLETKLKSLREMYGRIPTLPMGKEYVADLSIHPNAWRAKDPEIRYKSRKTFQHKVLVPAQFPKEGEGGTSLPAQIERWEENENVGQSTKNLWFGSVPSAEKAAILARLDALIQACKRARQRANDIEIKRQNVCRALFQFIHNG